jgi:hypothetical protein
LRPADQPIRAGESIRLLRLMSKVRQTAAFVAPMSSAATTTSFSASASIATGHHSAGHGAEPGEAGNDLPLRDRSNCARASKTWNRNSPCGVVVSICSVSETCPRVFSVTAARHCPTAAGAVLGGIRWLPLSRRSRSVRLCYKNGPFVSSGREGVSAEHVDVLVTERRQTR